MTRRFSLGIDNGLEGAVVLIDDQYKLMCYWDAPIVDLGQKGKSKKEFAVSEMNTIISKALHGSLFGYDCTTENTSVWIEQAHAMPKQGLSSTFKTGRGFGLWEGIIVARGLSYQIVPARRWTKEMLKDMPKGEGKARSLLKCQQLFPDIPLMKPRGRVLSKDGRSDAALIAYYGMKQMLGEKWT